MRIAFLVSTFPTLSETFILNQITGLIDRGHEVDILALKRGETSRLHGDVTKYILLNRTYYAPRLPRSKMLRILKGIFLFLMNFYRGPVVLLRSLNIFKYGKEAASLQLLYMAIPLIRRACDYDIIHCHFGPNAIKGVIMRNIGALHGKLVATLHGYDMSMYLRNKGNNVYKLLFGNGTLLLPISERWKRKLIEMGCDEKKILVHRMGIDCTKLNYHEPTLKNNEKIKILTIARLQEKKGVEYGICAFNELSKKYHNIEYVIVGDGPLRDRCTNLIQELNLGEKIHLLGWKDQKQVHRLISNSHICLSPSVTAANGDQEGIPVALMEAMAAGLPVISTFHSGIPELIQDGLSGFLVPEHDVKALSEKISYLIEHPEIWPEMGRVGRAYVEANYDIDKLNNKLVEIYEKLLYG